MTNLFISHSPCRQNKLDRWFKSIKDKNTIGGNILVNTFGKTKEEAEKRAELIVYIPKFIEALEKIKMLNDVTANRIIDDVLNNCPVS